MDRSSLGDEARVKELLLASSVEEEGELGTGRGRKHRFFRGSWLVYLGGGSARYFADLGPGPEADNPAYVALDIFADATASHAMDDGPCPSSMHAYIYIYIATQPHTVGRKDGS